MLLHAVPGRPRLLLLVLDETAVHGSEVRPSGSYPQTTRVCESSPERLYARRSSGKFCILPPRSMTDVSAESGLGLSGDLGPLKNPLTVEG